MKILVIMGSPHKGNTYAAAKKIEEAMRKRSDMEFEYLMLAEANLSPCRGCFICFLKGEGSCPIDDDAAAIGEKLENADGVIFASPVFGMNVTGLMKTFIDRFSYIFHRPRFFSKKALLLSTTGALGQKDVLKYLHMVAGIWGFRGRGDRGADHSQDGDKKMVHPRAGRGTGQGCGSVHPGPGTTDEEITGPDGRDNIPRTAGFVRHTA